MRVKQIKSNGSKVQSKSFKSILQKMMNLTRSGNLRVANSSWDIYSRVNDTNYSNTKGVSR